MDFLYLTREDLDIVYKSEEEAERDFYKAVAESDARKEQEEDKRRHEEWRNYSESGWDRDRD
ncbi:hypothetical protein NHP200010_15350 [Helicobacter bizzozeronii]|nr:hypothetical protein NHP200010_15350 [Helicobacter bizzozeronii]